PVPVSITKNNLAPVVVNDTAHIIVPPPSAPTLDPANDSGAKGDNITNVAPAFYNGTALAGLTVTVFSDGVAVGSGPATGGNYHIQVSPLADGSHQLTAQATDSVGGKSVFSGANTVIIDTVPPTSLITFPNAAQYTPDSWTGTLTGTADDTGG